MTVARSFADRERFVRENTRLGSPPLTPELKLWLADEATSLWEASETFLEETGLPPPFWAFAWAGGQALARHVLDNPRLVADKRVLDFGAGGGIVAIAALKAGARAALAVDVDPFAVAAVAANAAANDARPVGRTGDATDLTAEAFDVVLAADVCYDRAQSDPASAWLFEAAARNVVVLLGDPGRAYLPSDRLKEVAAYDVPTSTELENADVTRTSIWRLA